MSQGKPRAIGIVRVSRTRGREGERFVSPTEQADRVRAACERDGLELLRIEEELDVSGGRRLDKRPGLGAAVRAIEAGEADVIVGAYFDRLFRSITAQAEAVERVENAGGKVLAVDVGQISSGSAGQWLSASMLGIVAEYQRRTTGERVHHALENAMARGAAPYGRTTAGYRRRADGVFEPDPQTAPAVAEAFRMRAAGATVDAVWKHLRARGVEMTYGGVYALLCSRVMLGELHFGGFEPNLAAHEPIVDRETWEAVQGTRVPKGRHAQSGRLLARLGILRCGTCDSKMAGSTARGSRSAGGGGGKTYPIYRCGNKDCPRQMSIMCDTVDDAVSEIVRTVLADEEGAASDEQRARRAVAELERADDELAAAIRVLDIVGDEPAAVERLAALRAARDHARGEAERLGGFQRRRVIDASRWDDLSLDERRELVTLTIARVQVGPGRGVSRLGFELLV